MRKFSFILTAGFLIVAITLSPKTLVAQKYAIKVVSSLIGGKSNKNMNPDLILGKPDSPKPAVSNSYNLYNVSLGGGFIVVDMGVNIIDGNGPDIIIYEVGNSYTNASSEPLYVKGSSDMKPSSWVFLGEYNGDKTTIDLKTFNANNIRYIAIFDKLYKTDDNSASPGADIDAVEALNFK